jgi:hypothetical protein
MSGFNNASAAPEWRRLFNQRAGSHGRRPPCLPILSEAPPTRAFNQSFPGVIAGVRFPVLRAA